MNTLLPLKATAATDPGLTYAINADALCLREPSGPLERVQKGAIWAIADGVGSGTAALEASRLAAHAVVDAYWESAIPDPLARLRAAVERTNALLHAQHPPEVARREPTGATVLAAVAVGDRLCLAHVGRSRAYLLRQGALRRLTEDHSWVAEQVRAGKLPPEAAATHPRRNVITRCLGVKESVQVDLVEETLAAGDLLLLCSDGLYRDVEEARLAVILERYGAEAATVLVDEARRLGGHDNVTVVTVAVDPPLDRDSSLLDRIALLNRLGRELTMSLNLDATLRSVVEQLLVLTGGERAAILLLEPDGRLAPRVAHSVGAMGSLAGHSHSVAEQALRERKPVIVANALDDPRFATAESIIDLALRSIACVPMIVKEDAVGVLYVDSSAESGVFEQTELDLLVSFASQAAAAIQNARLHEALVARTRELELLRAQQDALIRSLSSALVAVDTAGRVTHWNPAAEEILGVPAASAIGAPLADLLPAPAATWLTNLMVETETDSQTMLMAHEWEGAVGRRGRVVLAARVARIQGPEGGVTGFAFILNDRTDIVLMDEARRAESAERERLRDLFGRYLAPPLVERLLNSPESVRLGGARHDITVLFADVRGFTGLSERLPPEEVVALLNQYLALATTEIFKEFGTLDKFMGDGVLAIFGAPLPVAQPERAAVRAALAMRARLDRLREETGVRVGFGIGLNSGEAIVGNIGTAQLMSYTAIGDVVNVAKRLQEEARSGEVLISEATLERLPGLLEVEELGPLYVKGRTLPVSTYKVLRAREEV